MTETSANNAKPPGASNPAGAQAQPLERLRQSLRVTVREHISRLSDDLFDEADDYLFAQARPGDSGAESSQLQAIRELRNRKELFEERFLGALDAALQATLVPRQPRATPVPPPSDQDMTPSVYERVEIDVALERMQRRAMKVLSRELEARGTLRGQCGSRPVAPVVREVLVDNVVRALGNSHGMLRLSLSRRLVLFKLFEQHLLLKMADLCEAITGLLSDSSGDSLVDSLFTPRNPLAQVSADGTEEAPAAPLAKPEPVDPNDELARQIAELVRSARENSAVPGFVGEMLDAHWREVLRLIGVRKGIGSRDWREASSVAPHLVGLFTEGGAQAAAEGLPGGLHRQIREGFALIQLPADLQTGFFQRLEESLAYGSTGHSAARHDSRTVSTEAGHGAAHAASRGSIGEVGRRILDTGDLEEIVALLSDVEHLGLEAPTGDYASMAYYLDLVDDMDDGAAAQISNLAGGQICGIHKSSNVENSYQVVDGTGQVLLTRSRVGLAISLRSGEIVLRGTTIHSRPRNTGTRTSTFDRTIRQRES